VRHLELRDRDACPAWNKSDELLEAQTCKAHARHLHGRPPRTRASAGVAAQDGHVSSRGHGTWVDRLVDDEFYLGLPSGVGLP